MTGGGPPPLLTLDGITKYFREDVSLVRRLRRERRATTVHAVDGVDLDVRRGETLGLVGESGCGKSTLARTALRLLEPTAGSIYFSGTDITEYTQRQLREFRSNAQMVFQDPFSSLNPRYTVERTLIEPMRVHGIGGSGSERVQRAAELLERVGLDEEHLERYPHEFSGGQRQRVAIARALSVEPGLLVADEPTSALDVSIQAKILRLLADLQSEMGLSMLFITHDLSVVRRVSDRVAVMYLGKVVENAPTNRLFTEPAHPYTKALISSVPVPDPTAERERIRLEGEVPTPIDPPRGCRFHPRCPEVIPPETWPGEQPEWRRLLQCKKRIENGEVRPAATRRRLAADRDSDVRDQDVVEALYDEHVTRSATAGTDEVTLPAAPERTVKEALTLLVEGDRTAAITLLNDAFPTVCQTTVPRDIVLADDWTVACHRYDADTDGHPLHHTVLATEPTDAESR